MKNYTILVFSGDLAKSVGPNLTYCKIFEKCYGELFDVHVFLNSERNCQSVAFNPLATYCLLCLRKVTSALEVFIFWQIEFLLTVES